MFSFYKPLLDTVKLNGVEHKVNMSVGNIYKILQMLEDERLKDAHKVMLGVKMLFEKPPAGNIEELAIIWEKTFKSLIVREEQFYEYDIKGNKMPKRSKDGQEQKSFDLFEDIEYIYASFLQDYNIDLHQVKDTLHWYQFNALLNGLSETTKLKKVIEIRNMPLPTGKGTGKQREDIQKLKSHYKLKGRG